MSLRELIIERIHTVGPLTFADYMKLALYHPEHGYYSRAEKRSGRAGDFFTSVDLGPLFGELLAGQFAEMWRILGILEFDLVEVGAGSGWLSRDILDAAKTSDPAFYASLRLQLVECSRKARASQPETLVQHIDRLAASLPSLPIAVSGAIFANELLDALPTHLVVMTESGLRETFVDAVGDQLVKRTGPLSTPDLETYFTHLDLKPDPGWCGEVNLSAIAWVQEAARKLQRGFLLLIDYGHDARELCSETHSTGTLTTYRHHVSKSATNSTKKNDALWLNEPGEHDITSHVDLSSIQRIAKDEGLTLVGLLDQTYFLMGLGITNHLSKQKNETTLNLKRRLAAKTLLLPGGLGSTHKVLVFSKGIETPRLRGCSYRLRVT